MVSVNSTTKKTKFTVKTTSVKQVALLGDFNGWNETSHPMKKGKANVWEIELNLEEGEYQFLYRVDGQWQTDDTAQRVINSFGSENCLAQINFPTPIKKESKAAPKKKAASPAKKK